MGSLGGFFGNICKKYGNGRVVTIYKELITRDLLWSSFPSNLTCNITLLHFIYDTKYLHNQVHVLKIFIIYCMLLVKLPGLLLDMINHIV